MMSATIRAVIVDDETPARTKIRRFLDSDPGVVVAGEATDGPSAISLVKEHSPDLVFLDVRMPGADGFAVVDAIAKDRPHVVFATAFAEHAVRAFEVGAADYLLKPFDRERFNRALDRAKSRIRNAEPAPDATELRALLRALRGEAHQTRNDPRAAPLQRLLIKNHERSFFVPVEAVTWLEAQGNYVRVHERTRENGARSHLIRRTLKSLEDGLDPGQFARVSRRAIVNLDRVKEFHDWSHGDRLIVLDDGTEVKLSRRYRSNIEP